MSFKPYPAPLEGFDIILFLLFLCMPNSPVSFRRLALDNQCLGPNVTLLWVFLFSGFRIALSPLFYYII